MEKNNYCSVIDLPALNKDSESSLLEFVKANTKKFHSFTIWNNLMYTFKITNLLRGVNYFLPTVEADQLFLKNILEVNNIALKISPKNIHLQHIKTNALPHRDPQINLKLIYNIQGKAVTNFYTVKDQYLKNVSLDKTMLDLQHSIKMNLNQWYLINVGEIHDVELIEGIDRTAIVIDISKTFITFTEAVNNYKSILNQ